MTDESKTATGGCQCGAIRFEAHNRLSGGFLCHCRMCQRASGSAFTLNALYPRDSFSITTGEPRWYASSAIMERGFCTDCGTPLFVRYSVPEWLGWVGVSVTVHDNPEAIPPERHFGFESKLAWLHIHDDLPHSEYPDKFLESVGVDDNDAYATLTKVGR